MLLPTCPAFDVSMTERSVDDDPILSTDLIGILMLARGLGNILSTPVASALRQKIIYPTTQIPLGFDVAGGRYGSMIIFVGACFAVTAALTGLAWMKEKKI